VVCSLNPKSDARTVCITGGRVSVIEVALELRRGPLGMGAKGGK
jgi:hypothetical protein